MSAACAFTCCTHAHMRVASLLQVHADLSEYNLLYWQGRVVVIDFGQAVDTSHPNAHALLRADCRNINTFFRRKGVHVLSDVDLMALVITERVAPHPILSGERTGSHASHAPAPGSGIPLLPRLIERESIAMDATEGIIAPVDSACDGDPISDEHTQQRMAEARLHTVLSELDASARSATGRDPRDDAMVEDYFDGDNNAIAAAVDAMLHASE